MVLRNGEKRRMSTGSKDGRRMKSGCELVGGDLSGSVYAVAMKPESDGSEDDGAFVGV